MNDLQHSIAVLRAPAARLREHLEVLRTQFYQCAQDMRKVELTLRMMLEHAGIWTNDEIVHNIRVKLAIWREARALNRQIVHVQRQISALEVRFTSVMRDRFLLDVLEEFMLGEDQDDDGISLDEADEEGAGAGEGAGDGEGGEDSEDAEDSESGEAGEDEDEDSGSELEEMPLWL
ncbi:uncharacterized protein H6S33_011060 [Morchella sextelata]|uniref:uncharacterized protein n=1 Tax=Morchella sextelata TaxID=1174677 RepID=UPI001D05457A|nr:uncharacterized protein H6S33_011060 [Morchella sextelata]KAH0611795.1 hypothetical protein H6S33_011060 [Morchella sextelata]